MQPELIDAFAIVRAATEQISNECVETKGSGGEFIEHHGCDLKGIGERTSIQSGHVTFSSYVVTSFIGPISFW